MICQTKSATGKLLKQDCKRRSVVYETRCLTCEERKKKEIESKYENLDLEDEIRSKEMKEEMSRIVLYKYIGETGKSSYERGRQHLSDAKQLKPSSHILKHFFDCHEEEKLDNIKFGMKINTTARSAFERQVTESVIIQQESKSHNILNSKSEYNRCALPRLTTKLGDKEFEMWKKETQEEKKKEEELERKIRSLRKERNKERKTEPSRICLPAEKKRKLGQFEYKKVLQT